MSEQMPVNRVADVTMLYAILKREYAVLSELLLKTQQTIHNNHYVLCFDLTTNMRILHNVTKSLNDTFNKQIEQLLISGQINENEIDEQTVALIYKLKNIPPSTCPQKYKRFVLFNPFSNVMKELIDLCTIVGYPSICDILYLHGTTTDVDYTFLNNMFFPTSCKIIAGSVQMQEAPISITKPNSVNNKHIMLFNNQCVIEFATNKGLLKITGYTKLDELNISLRTSQNANPFLYQRKMNMEKVAKSLKNIASSPHNALIASTKDGLLCLSPPPTFLHLYLDNITLTDILTFDETKFTQRILHDYKYFCELSQQSLVKIMRDFPAHGIEHMFLTIKLLLIGDEMQVNIAKLLFNLLKDKKQTEGSEIIADLIYTQLSFSLQTKLKKTDESIDISIERLRSSSFSTEADQRKQLALSRNIPDHIKKLCYEKLDELKTATSEASKIKNYVTTLIQFPWIVTQSTPDAKNKFKAMCDNPEAKTFLENLKNKLDTKIYGHTIAKTKIRRMIGKMISGKPNVVVQCIGLCGGMGLGKSMFANCVAECMGIPFVQILLGGENSSELLLGHSYTYSGAQCGLIVKKMVEAGQSRCIMYFDELDKCVPKNGMANEVTNVLIHLTDPLTNKAFQDRFFQENTFPLNEVIFMFSFNDKEKVDKILLDRMEIIDIGNYSGTDKLAIAKNHLIPNAEADIGMEKQLVFTDETIKFIINSYTREAGVRKLKEKLENIYLSMNDDKIMEINEFVGNRNAIVNVTPEIVERILGKIIVEKQKIHANPEKGIINGLYASSGGGGILPIQMRKKYAMITKEEFITVTGNLEKIMLESVHYAFSCACGLITKDCLDNFMKEYAFGVHVHCVNPAVSKDGSSASVALTTAFLSLMLDCKIKNCIGVTGEIDILGNAYAIGGLFDKISGGFASGITTIIAPISNKGDVDEVRKNNGEIFSGEVLFVENVLDVVKIAFVDFDSKKHLLKLV
jgi:ATP-dependent Lon protease